MTYRALSVAYLLALTGCIATSPAIKAALAPAAPFGSLVECESGACKERWERAQLWVAHHAKWKIQTATDVLIETYNPMNYRPDYGFSITKEPTGGGRYRIVMALHCGNAFGCSPAPEDVKTAFAYYVIFGTDLLAGVRGLSAIR